MKRLIDLATWERNDHFHFFREFEEPFFGITVNVDCTSAYTNAKSIGTSFFLHYLYASLRAANRTEAFRYRIIDNEVWLYDQVHASPTINRPNGTFGFAYIDYYENKTVFLQQAEATIERVQSTSGLVPALSGENVIHYSSIPWLHFTALSHARMYKHKDSIPKISFGKMEQQNGSMLMPMSVHAHHGLVDGYHVGQYVSMFQSYLNE